MTEAPLPPGFLRHPGFSPRRALADLLLPTEKPLRLNLDGYRLSLFVLTVMTFSRIHQHFAILKAMHPALVLVALAGMFAVFDRDAVFPGSAFRTWPTRVILAFGILACISAPFGISLGSSGAFILSDYSKTILYAVLVLLALRNVRDLYTFVWAYLIGMAVLAWMAFFVFDLSSLGSRAERLGRLYSWDGNDVGVLMVVGLGLTLLTLQSSTRVGKLFSGFMVLAIGVTLGRTGSRGAFVGMIACMAALLFASKSASVFKRVGFVIAVAAVFVLSAPPGYWAQMDTIAAIKDDYNWSSVDGRRQVAQRGFQYLWAHPVFGLGINNFSRAECLDPESPKVRNHRPGTGLRCTAPHNSVLQAGAELGIPGLLLWLGMLVGGIVGMFRLRRRLPPDWANGTHEERFLYRLPLFLGVAMVGFAVSSTFVTFAWLDLVYFLAALMAGTYSVTAERLRRIEATARARPRPARAPLAALGTLPTGRT